MTNFLSEQGLATQIANTKSYVLTAIAAALGGVAKTKTLTAAGWTSQDGKYVQTISDTDIFADTNGSVAVSTTATDNQYKAAAKAYVRVSSQTDGSVTFIANKQPTIDITIDLWLV